MQYESPEQQAYAERSDVDSVPRFTVARSRGPSSNTEMMSTVLHPKEVMLDGRVAWKAEDDGSNGHEQIEESPMSAPFGLSGHLTPPLKAPPPPTPLLWTDGVDTYFARDLKHLEELFDEHTGSSWEHEVGEPMADGWTSSPVDDTELEVWFDQPDDIRKHGPPGCGLRATGRMSKVGPELTRWWAIATRRQWFETIGYGFVASTEF